MITISDMIKKSRIFVQDKIRGNFAGDSLIAFLKALGVNDLLTSIIYRQDRKHPTGPMINAENYYTTHKKETDEITALLADDLSREVYQAAIRYRTTHNPKDAPVYSKHDQYFVKDVVALTEEEVFVDCGAFDGDTMKAFIKASGGTYKSIVCFEPVEEFHKRLKKRGEGKRVTAICAGVYKENTTLHFNADGGKGSAITSSAENSSSVPVRAIDTTPECHDATFIKMDVEGSEPAALLGAKETILRNKPKLAICIYHRHRDFVEIPMWIHKLVPDYKLYVRHHSYSINETVLYAIPPED